MIKKILPFVLAMIILLPFFNVKAFGASKLSLASDTAVLMDAKTGQILYEKQMNKQKEPASITKIATVYLSMLGTNPEEKITVAKEDALKDLRVTHIALLEGEEVTLRDLQCAAMLMSANDACNVIARYVGGSYDDFVDKLNTFAENSGANSTKFTNPHGLPDPDHYTTAYDMALMTREAIKSQEFLELFGMTTYEMPATNKQPARPFACQDAMLKSFDPMYYEWAKGAKLGWTEEAGHTKVTVAERNNRTLIAVVMDSQSKDDKYEDTKKLFEYGFEEFGEYTISPHSVETKQIPVTDGANEVGTMDIYLGLPAKIYLHKSINTKEITYRMPEIDTIDKSEEQSVKFNLEVILPEYASEVMYGTSMTLKLDTLFTPKISTVTENSAKDQIMWVALEAGKIIGISAGVTISAALFIMMIVLIRKYMIIYRREKRKRRIEQKRKKQLENLRVIERQRSPYKMNTRPPQSKQPPQNIPQKSPHPQQRKQQKSYQSQKYSSQKQQKQKLDSAPQNRRNIPRNR